MNLTKEQKTEHVNRVERGEKAKAGLESDFWIKIVKPVIDSMIKGIEDPTSLHSEKMSDRDIAVEVRGRKLGKDYIMKIEELIKEYQIEALTSRKILNPKENKLYKHKR